MKTKTDWNLKVKITCPNCLGTSLGTGDWGWATFCPNCEGTGEVIEKVPPKEIEQFIERPEKAHFMCVGCNKKEDILRPLPNQLPHNWTNWHGDVICNACTFIVVTAAITAVDHKIRQMKDHSNTSQRGEK